LKGLTAMATGGTQGLADRIEELEAELAATRAREQERAASLTSLTGSTDPLRGPSRERELEAEIQAVRTRLDGRARRGRSLLDEVRVASPCTASWDEMEGDDRVRHCKACDRKVFYLSAMTSLEAERILAEHDSPCVRLWERADGTVMTSDCPVGRRRLRVRNVIAVAGSAAVFAALAILQSDPAPVAKVAERGLGRARSLADPVADSTRYAARLRDLEDQVGRLKHRVMGGAPRRLPVQPVAPNVEPKVEPKTPTPPPRGTFVL
jgi:hypothetical protein